MDYLLLCPNNSSHIEVQANLVTVVAEALAKGDDHSEELGADLIVNVDSPHHFRDGCIAVDCRNDQLPLQNTYPRSFSMGLTVAGVAHQQ